MIEKIRKIVLTNRRLAADQIAERVKISAERTFNILKNELNMLKVSGKWRRHHSEASSVSELSSDDDDADMQNDEQLQSRLRYTRVVW